MKLEELNAVRLFTLQRAIGALIKTHPHPDHFADVFEQGTAMTQALHVLNADTPPEVRQEALAFAQELIGLARDEAQARKSR